MNIEVLIEAIECNNDYWWEEFEEKEEALELINSALKETPEDDDIIIFLSLVEPNISIFNDGNPIYTYREVLRKLRRELKENVF